MTTYKALGGCYVADRKIAERYRERIAKI